ncbi:NAD(P)-dependent oxidoreductase [Rhodobacter maris]|uniref:3-hydroxyisobutyrate dehydrogenase n=1 Tax=Rhodobacter maris TaxID=446682 RepID=A0A285RI03_9RHOB|nr:NAD(P)-binding domain-containing protein [Rhodobacter maris]SOB93733.1 3-hydroxyisobutyrate dehydrogenase [Rhodobacter maris]
MTRIGVIGLGRMGAAMAERFVAQGAQVCGWTRSGRTVPGIDSAPDMESLVAQSEVIALSLLDDAAVAAVLDALLKRDLSGKLVADTSTADPHLLCDRAAAFAARGAQIVDAPISGGPELVRAGACGVFIGGEDAAAAQAQEVMALLSGRVFHTGPLGTGLVMKVINNGMLQAYFSGLADLLPMARAAGLPLETVLTILAGGPAGLPMLKDRMAKILGSDPGVGFPVSGVMKDNALFRAILASYGQAAPTLERFAAQAPAAAAAGLWEADLAALVRLAYAAED